MSTGWPRRHARRNGGFVDAGFVEWKKRGGRSRPSVSRELRTTSCGASGYCWWARRLAPSIVERVGAELEVKGDRHGALAALLEPRRPVAARRPHPAPFPSRIGIVDAAVKALGIEAQRVGDAQDHPFPFHQRQQRVVFGAGRYRNVVAKPQRIVLIDPGIIARLGAVVADAIETRPRILVQGPALRAVIAGGFGPVQRTLALAPVEAAEMPAAERHPHHTLGVDVSAPRSKAR